MIKRAKIKLSNDKHLSELISSSLISFVLRITGIGFGYLFIWLISKNFGAAMVGVFTLAFTILQIASIIGRFGLDTALLRFVSESLAHNNLKQAAGSYTKAVLLTFFIAFVFSILIYHTSYFIANIIFSNSVLAETFQVASYAIVPMTLINLNFETLRALKKIRAYAFLQNVSTFLWASFLLSIFITNIQNAKQLFELFTIAVTITWFTSQILVIRVFYNSFSFAGHKLSYLIKTSLPMMISSSLMLIMGWTDIIMIGIFLDENNVGIYNVALKIATITSITLMAVNSMAAQKFAEFFSKNDLESLQKIVTQSSQIIFWTSMPILIVSIVFSKELLALFGKEFDSAVWALIILCLGQFINAISGSVGYLLQMTGEEKAFQKIILISLFINIILNLFLIPSLGILGAAIATFASKSIWNIFSLMYIYKKMRIKTFYFPFIAKDKL